MGGDGSDGMNETLLAQASVVLERVTLSHWTTFKRALFNEETERGRRQTNLIAVLVQDSILSDSLAI